LGYPAFAAGTKKVHNNRRKRRLLSDEFGQQMVTDHTKLNDELGKAAQSIGLQIPKDLSAQQQTEFQTLSKASGKQFDAKYASLMVKDHTNDLAAFKKAEASTRSPELKQAISDAIPVIEHHLEMAKATAEKVGASRG
jgi:putative membrane protein